VVTENSLSYLRVSVPPWFHSVVLLEAPKEKATDAWPGDVDCGTLRTKATRGEAARSSYALLRFRRRLGRVLRHGLGRRFCGLPNDCTRSCPCYARVTTGGELWQVKRLPSSYFGQVSTVLRSSAAEVDSVTNTTYGVGSCASPCWREMGRPIFVTAGSTRSLWIPFFSGTPNKPHDDPLTHRTGHRTNMAVDLGVATVRSGQSLCMAAWEAARSNAAASG
jgi:hypothetical protein